MFDHVSIDVRDFKEAKTFYTNILAPFGISVLVEKSDSCGFGKDRPFFWVGVSDSNYTISKHVHLAFWAENKEQVKTFYQTALAMGAKDNGAPDYHTLYNAGYYAAFVFDLDGNNIEAVYRDKKRR